MRIFFLMMLLVLTSTRLCVANEASVAADEGPIDAQPVIDDQPVVNEPPVVSEQPIVNEQPVAHEKSESVSTDSKQPSNSTPTPPAKVYKWVDDKGMTHYGDQPPSKDMVPIDLPAIQIIDSAEVAKQGSLNSTTPTPTATPEITNNKTTAASPEYKLNITAPKNDETVMISNDGTVFVALSINTPLLEGHHILMNVDGQEISIDNSGAVNVPVHQGSHNVQVSITDSNKNVLTQSNVVSFKAVDGNGNARFMPSNSPVTMPPTAVPTNPPTTPPQPTVTPKPKPTKVPTLIPTKPGPFISG